MLSVSLWFSLVSLLVDSAHLYTQWQRTLWPDKSIKEINQAAMRQRHADQSTGK